MVEFNKLTLFKLCFIVEFSCSLQVGLYDIFYLSLTALHQNIGPPCRFLISEISLNIFTLS